MGWSHGSLGHFDRSEASCRNKANALRLRRLGLRSCQRRSRGGGWTRLLLLSRGRPGSKLFPCGKSRGQGTLAPWRSNGCPPENQLVLGSRDCFQKTTVRGGTLNSDSVASLCLSVASSGKHQIDSDMFKHKRVWDTTNTLEQLCLAIQSLFGGKMSAALC